MVVSWPVPVPLASVRQRLASLLTCSGPASGRSRRCWRRCRGRPGGRSPDRPGRPGGTGPASGRCRWTTGSRRRRPRPPCGVSPVGTAVAVAPVQRAAGRSRSSRRPAARPGERRERAAGQGVVERPAADRDRERARVVVLVVHDQRRRAVGVAERDVHDLPVPPGRAEGRAGDADRARLHELRRGARSCSTRRWW